MKPRLRSFPPLAVALIAALDLLSPAGGAEPTADGLYAGVTTSMGEFWCQLEYQRTPRTVANVVTLAEGSRPWIDFSTAKIVRKPFYDGITFHRVIANFMVQAGSPNGRGTDGPGYRFADEFDAALRHDRPGILSMANSGEDSNGSQFFVTVTNTPWLDGVHSVFGAVVEGMDVVHAISKVPTDANGRPVTPVVIQGVRILRIGAAAQAFDPAQVTPPLPDVGVVPIALDYNHQTSTNLNLRLQPREDHLLHAFFGSDLSSLGYQTFPNPTTNLVADSLLGRPAMFFRVLDGGFER